MIVRVKPLEITGDTVRFAWEQSVPNSYQLANQFWFRYQDVDLARFEPYLFWEIFLALQLKVFAAYPEPVEIEFPGPLSRQVVAFWLAFHDADRVTISPTSERGTESPWR